MPHKSRMKTAQGRPEAGHKSVQSQDRIAPELAQTLPKVGPRAVKSWLKVRLKTAQSRPTAFKLVPKLATRQPRVELKLDPDKCRMKARNKTKWAVVCRMKMAQDRTNVDPKVGPNWPDVSPKLTPSPPKVDKKSTRSQPKVGPNSAESLPAKSG